MNRKRILKKAIVFAIVAILLISNSISAFACTHFYLGKNTTVNGSVIWGRTEDFSTRYRKLHMVHPAETHESGDMFESSSGFKWPYPEKTLSYTYVRDSFHNEGESPEPYAEAGMNEKNVAISATVTLGADKTAIIGNGGVDSHVSAKNGAISEQDLTSVVLMQATSARDAVELVARIIDEKGCDGREGFMVSDPNEVWYMQFLSGHQYIAVKAPEDKIGFSPNIMGNVNGNINDKENVIASPGIILVPQQAGTLVLNGKDNIKVADSYGDAMGTPTNRLWTGYYYLKGREAAEALKPGEYLEFFTAPRESKNYTLYEAMRLLAYRGEGTERYGESIGNSNNLEAHVFETRDNMPEALATIEWLSLAPPEFGVYLPSYGSLITEVFDKYYTPDNDAYNSNDPDANTVYYVFRELHNLCKGVNGTLEMRTKYGAGVKEFWERYQLSLIEQQAKVDEDMLKFYDESPELAKEMATKIYKAISEETYEYAKQMLSELKAFQAAGTEGSFIPSLLADENAIPHYSFEKIAVNTHKNPEGKVNSGEYTKATTIMCYKILLPILRMQSLKSWMHSK